MTPDQKVSFYKSLVEGAPQATLTPILNSRHFPMLDQPQPLHKALTDFLAR